MSEQAPAPVGHNRGPTPLTAAEIPFWLTDEYAGMLKRRRELVDGATAFAAKYPEIGTDDVSAAATENLELIRKTVAAVEDRRKQAKEPFLEGGRAVDKWFADVKTSLQQAAGLIAPALKTYLEAKETRERAAAIAEAKRLADLADEAALEAEETGEFDQAVAVAKDAEQAAAVATGKPGPLTRTTGTYGSSSSLQEVWLFEVEDDDALPRQYLMRDERAIRAAIARGVRKIAGVRIYAERKVRTR